MFVFVRKILLYCFIIFINKCLDGGLDGLVLSFNFIIFFSFCGICICIVIGI